MASDFQSRCHRHDYQSLPGRRRDHDSLSTEFGDHFRYLSSYIRNISTGKIVYFCPNKRNTQTFKWIQKYSILAQCPSLTHSAHNFHCLWSSAASEPSQHLTV